MEPQKIIVKGARQHNLKNVSVNIPRNKFVVVTGVSGSGKSTLAFDTIYAEGQRRYVESLSSYARQFLGRMDKPDVDYIEGLSPSISIDQKNTSQNPRSTVGTTTEIYDYLRLLFARVGEPHCYKCGNKVQKQTIPQIVDTIQKMDENHRIMILSPKVIHKKGEHKQIFEQIKKDGFVRVRVDNEVRELTENIELNKQKWHTIELIVDRITSGHSTDASRIHSSVETALTQGEGTITILDVENNLETAISEDFACVNCGINFTEIEPRTFSFNSPHGACNRCSGIGYHLEVDPDLVIPDYTLSMSKGGILPWSSSGRLSQWGRSILASLADKYNFNINEPLINLSDEIIDIILHGDNDTINITHVTKRGMRYQWNRKFEGLIPNLERRYQNTDSDYSKKEIEKFMSKVVCPECNGNRLKPTSLSVKIGTENIISLTNMSIKQTWEWTKNQLDRTENYSPIPKNNFPIAEPIIKEIKNRLEFLIDIGLDYISLDRPTSTLSGGESQRIRLATQIGSGLVGVLYVCDEPSIGLHPADGNMLITTLKKLRDLGNSLLVVEHDEAVMESADYIIDLGPGAGENGGYIIAEGPLKKIKSVSESLTGSYLSGRNVIPTPYVRRKNNGNTINIVGARENNLKNISVEVPLGNLVCITGVSGSGKSTLINEVLYKKLNQTLNKARAKAGDCDYVEGIENITKVINIDQSPIGRTPRSNPATYCGVFTPIRELFSMLPEAKMRGYAPGRFSFNVRGGRCEACSGEGSIEIEMQFLANVTIPCEICEGARYNSEALTVLFNEHSISNVLNLTVDQAIDLFSNIPKIVNKLTVMKEVGLGYIKLGQPATTLSGGEAQRVKLATELSKRSLGHTLYILDEPTTGLSLYDCEYLLEVIQKLVDKNNTVILIEHHLDLIKNADWIIDLGPKAGENGGYVIATGTPEFISKQKKSITGKYLVPKLNKEAYNVLQSSSIK